MQNLTESTIHIRVPAELKGELVRESRKAGMRLAEWIKMKVENDTNRTARHAQAGLTQKQAAEMVQMSEAENGRV